MGVAPGSTGILLVVDPADLDPDPLVALRAWLADAAEASPQPDAMAVATSTPEGRPSARVVLLRGIDERGLVFFTNLGSRKGGELAENPRAAAVLHWWELGRQVRIEGAVEEVARDESAAYWATRPRASRVAAWASPQSETLSDREELETLVEETEERFAEELDVPLPGFWGGLRIVPDFLEFWEHREDRLHDRIGYVREGGGWRRERLAP
jgi:pyridoxamine 5'-phosphate oxidase